MASRFGMSSLSTDTKQRPVHLPMSDNEDTTEDNEPYSKAYHDRISRQAQLAVDADDEVSRFPTDMFDDQRSQPSTSTLQIVSVCSLNVDQQPIQRSRDENTNSSNSMPGETNSSGEVNALLQEAPTRRIFGIAQNRPNPEPVASESDPDELLVEQAPKEVMRRGRPAATQKRATNSSSSKLHKIRHKLNKMRFRTQPQQSRQVIRPLVEQAQSSATNTDDQSDPEELLEDPLLGVQSTSHSTPSSATVVVPKLATALQTATTSSRRRKTIHQPIADGDIEFFEPSTATTTQPEITHHPVPVTWFTQKTARPITEPATVSRETHRMNVLKNIPNPNMDILKKVAFLRTCANYMMTELGLKQFDFQRNMSFADMLKQYKKQRS